MKKKIFGYMFYSLAMLIILLYIFLTIDPYRIIPFETTIIFVLLVCIFIYIGGILLSKYYHNKKPLKFNLWLFFILYILLLIDLTLLDLSWGRHGFLLTTPNFEYLKNSINLIPFKTIYEYLIKNFNNLTTTSIIFYNIFGNFIALMPMAFFLPLLFKKENKFSNFFLTIFLIVFGIELTQLFGLVGRFDVDDIILNVSGALTMFGILKIKTLNNLIRNIFLLEKNKIDYKKLIKLLIIFALIFLILIAIIKYHNHLYSKNLDTLHYEMKIIDESNSCTQTLDKFYEDDLYTYYFPFEKSNQVYAIINDKDKYLVKDLLNNNPSPYSVDITKIEERFKFYKIDYIKENKYEYTTLNIDLIEDGNSYYTPNITIKNSDEQIIKTKLDYKNALIKDHKYIINLHFIPLKTGNSELTIIITDDNSNELSMKKYKVEVDKDLNVKYELIV